MNEISPKIIEEFLKNNDLILKSTHPKICLPILKRILNKLTQGERFDPIKIEDNIIINGHHRYVCLSILNLEVETIKWTRSPSVTTIPWNEVEIVTLDWDTLEDIERHNKISSEHEMSQ